MKKLIKWIVGLGTVGTAIGLLAVRLIKKSKSTSSDIKADSTNSNKEETDSDTFDLDQDLEPTQERSYVSLQAAQPDDLTEKSDVDSADSSEVETQPAVSDESNDTIAEKRIIKKKADGSILHLIKLNDPLLFFIKIQPVFLSSIPMPYRVVELLHGFSPHSCLHNLTESPLFLYCLHYLLHNTLISHKL